MDLQSLRAQLGEAAVEARLAEARGRMEIVQRLESELEAGQSFQDAARRVEADVTRETLRRWLKRWRASGLAGLVDRQRGPVPVGAEPAPSPAAVQLGLPIDDLHARARPSPRPRRSNGLPAGLLKWPGSKQSVVEQLVQLTPDHFGVYHEPFVGSGALFFALRPGQAFLGDENAELVNLYRVTRDEPDALIRALGMHRNTREDYQRMRGLLPDALCPVERAARTLFLNRTCFNGLYRVNRHGIFNVPYGSQAHSTFFQPSAIRDACQALRRAEIHREDFETCVGRAQARDLVYLDPPYPVGMNEGTPFKYQAGGFGEEEQRRVAQVFRTLDARGCFVMASNADTPLTRRLYSAFDVVALSVVRRIGGHVKRRGSAAEILVRNFTGRLGTLPGM